MCFQITVSSMLCLICIASAALETGTGSTFSEINILIINTKYLRAAELNLRFSHDQRVKVHNVKVVISLLFTLK